MPVSLARVHLILSHLLIGASVEMAKIDSFIFHNCPLLPIIAVFHFTHSAQACWNFRHFEVALYSTRWNKHKYSFYDLVNSAGFNISATDRPMAKE